MHSLVDRAEAIFTNPESDLDEIGVLLDETWHLKKSTGAHISSSAIDELYEAGKQAGALGGKLLGAGGGGFLLFYVPRERQEDVLKRLNHILHVPFHFENGGSRIIHNSAACMNAEAMNV